MRVCQFRHFGTRHEPGWTRPTGSIFESRKCQTRCQIHRERTRDNTFKLAICEVRPSRLSKRERRCKPHLFGGR